MTRVKARATRTFLSLRVRNYRLFFLGQIVSLTGTWMQGVAQAWLVLQLTGSGTALGLTAALQFVPMLVLGPWGGVLADRVDKRRTLVLTNVAAAALALLLGLVTAFGVVEVWMIYVLAVLVGLVNVVDMPTRQAFVLEMVGADDVANAVSLNSVLVNAARVVGPAVGGVLIASVGVAAAFLLNAGSYVAPVVGLLLMRSSELHRRKPVAKKKGQLREGLAYVWRTPELRIPLLLMVVVGAMAFEFTVTLPLMARYAFHAGPESFGLLTSAFGVGAIVGGLTVAGGARPRFEQVVRGALAFGLLLFVAAAAPNLAAEAAVLVLVGGVGIAFLARSNATLQLTASPAMRGRVMALYGVAFLGTTPIGGPVVGWIGEHAGPRWSLVAGAGATTLAALAAWRSHAAAGGAGAIAPDTAPAAA